MVLAAAICFFSLSGQLHWENLFPEPEMTGQMQLPIYAEFFVLPLFFGTDDFKDKAKTSSQQPFSAGAGHIYLMRDSGGRAFCGLLQTPLPSP